MLKTEGLNPEKIYIQGHKGLPANEEQLESNFAHLWKHPTPKNGDAISKSLLWCKC